LPIEETLKRLLEEPLAEHSELFILLSSLPNRQNIVWQDLVDVNTIYYALQKLHSVNPLYQNIVLPSIPEDLHLEGRITEDVPESDVMPTVDSQVLPDNEPMVRKISKKEEDDVYANYTIQPLHAPRLNQMASDLYHMQRVDEHPLDSHTKKLYLYCFPDLFPRAVGGLHQARETALGAADYVKVLLMSRISRFRLNLQFKFYHFHQATLRQLASGIYHKLKVIRPHEKITAAQYLQKLENEVS